MKDIILLGATGSIGTQTLDIIEKNPELYQLKAIAFGHNINKALEIIDHFHPSIVCTPFDDVYTELKKRNDLKVTKNIKEVVTCDANNPYVVNAIVGVDGLVPTIETIKCGRILLLANKESMVMAGELVNTIRKQSNSIIVPIDSEHSALYQLLKVAKEEIQKLYITASGGALRDYPLEKLENVSVKEALNHPNWKMGAKITIDSATMMNKVFEIVEAHYLFGYPLEKIEAVVDRQSKIHAMVEYSNGMVSYHMAQNDMHLPIEYALSYPESVDFNEAKEILDLQEVFEKYHLEKMDEERFPLFKLANYILVNKGFSGVIITTINDLLVNKFINKEIKYKEIERNIFKYLKYFEHMFDDLTLNIENILKVKKIVTEEVNKTWI